MSELLLSSTASVERKVGVGDLLVLSSTFREADTDHREALAARLPALADALHEHVVLHTCHRVELVGLTPADHELPALSGTTLARGADAVERVLLVVGGLDSAVLAEEQLLGQARAAYQTAMAEGTTGPVLNELFRRAIRFGRRARSLAQPGGDRSLAQRAVRWVDERLGLEPRPAAALVIGSGQMGRLLATELLGRGMTVTVGSRKLEVAARLCADLPVGDRATPLDLAEALAGASSFDLIALATRATSPVLEAAHLAGAVRLPLVIDLSAPRNVADDAGRLLGDRLLDLDRLGEAAPSALDGTALRRLRAEATEQRDAFLRWLNTRSSADGVAMLVEHAAEVRERHLGRLRRAGRLDDAQLAAVEATVAAMMGEILHGPIVRLRQDPRAAAAVRHLFGIDA